MLTHIMLVIGILFILIGMIVVILGFVIIKKQWVNAVSMHAHMKPENAKVFTKLVGIATVGFGLSIICMGIFLPMNLFILGIILFAVIFAASLWLYFIAQSEYNRMK